MKNHIVLDNVMNLGSGEQIGAAIVGRILKDGELLRPLGEKLEGGSGKELMTAGIDEPVGKPLRRWSKFG